MEIERLREDLIGLHIDDVRDVTDMLIRVVKRDGKSTIVTQDHKLNRVNVAVEGGIITEVVKLG